MDGTLLKYDQTISDHTRKVIKEAVDMGLSFMLGTGRSESECMMYYDNLPLRYVICANGTYVLDRKTGTELYQRFIPIEDARQIYEIYAQFDPIIFVQADHWVYACEDFPVKCRRFPEYIAGTAPVDLPYRFKDDLREFLLTRDDNIEKFHVSFRTHEDAQKAYDMLIKLPYAVVWCGDYAVEVTHPEADKGKALEIVAQKLGLERQEVMAIGDSENDKSMLMYAGVSCAVSNAQDCIKSMVDHIIPSNDEDGVAWAIQHLI